MPKKLKRVNKFHKGLVNNPDKRDIPEGGLANATNVMVDTPGQIRQTGNETTSTVLSDTGSLTGSLTPGYGVHILNADHNMANVNTETSRLVVVQSNSNFNIVDNGVEYNKSGLGEIDTGWSQNRIVPCFFDANGVARVSQSDLTLDDKENYAFTHINKEWFGDTVRPINPAGGQTAGGDWIDVKQRIKRPSAGHIGDEDTIATDAVTEGTVYVSIEETNVDAENGEWVADSNMKFGVSFLYDGVGELHQESLIHILAGDTIDTSSGWAAGGGKLGIKMAFVAKRYTFGDRP